MAVKISRILHAGYIFECDQTQIAFDPIFENPFSQNCYAFPGVEFDLQQIKKLKLDAVFISHYHDDHCSLESLNLLDRTTSIYVYCLHEEMFSMIRELGFHKVYSLTINDPVKIGSFQITPKRALDADVDSIFHIQSSGFNILNVVDSWIDDEVLHELAQTTWDIVLWPFQTMREIEVLSPSRAEPAPKELPREWIEQLKILNPKYIIPSSCQFLQEEWSWYNHAFFPVSYKQFQSEIENVLSQTYVVRLNPSVSIVLDKNKLEYSRALPWIKPIGEQNVDYEYRPDAKPPQTFEIAKRLLSLDKQQLDRVYDYCTNGILEKYNSMNASQEKYFDKPRIWQLSLYEHNGEATHFRYQIKSGNLTRALEDQNPIAWTTEIPIAKLYAALELGESLTSMYIRINDQKFAPEIEQEIKGVDIVEDPLISCLFNGVFGAYQLAQLKRIRPTSRV